MHSISNIINETFLRAILLFDVAKLKMKVIVFEIIHNV